MCKSVMGERKNGVRISTTHTEKNYFFDYNYVELDAPYHCYHVATATDTFCWTFDL